MRRRSFLASALAGVAGLSGCSGLTGDGTNRDPYDVPPTTTETETATDTETPTGTPTTTSDDPSGQLAKRSVIDLEVGPRTYAMQWFSGVERVGIDFSVGFTETATTDHPPLLTTVISNGLEVPTVFDRHRLTTLRHPVGTVRESDERNLEAGDDRPRLLLVPTDRNELAREVPRVERAQTYWRTTGDVDSWYPDRVRLDPGERIVAEQAIVGPRGTTGRPTGTYQFWGGNDGLSIVVWNTDRPGPTGDSRFGPQSPETPGDRSTTWYHTATPETGAYLRPGLERTDLPKKVPFEFVNHTHEAVSCGGWRLYKRHDGRWYRIGRSGGLKTDVCRLLSPGGTAEWTLYAYHGPGLEHEGDGTLTQYLGGGRYAVTVGYGAKTEASGALLTIDAEPVSVRPTDDATVERSGSTAVVTSAAVESADADPVNVTVARVDDGDPAGRRFIPEQVMQPSRVGLRNVLGAFADGVDRVRLRTTSDRIPQVSRFAFDGSTYEMRGVDG